MKKYINLYIKFLKRFIKIKKPLKVVIDCSSGTAGLGLDKLLKISKLLKFKIINSKPDGNFLSHSPNPMQERSVNQLVREVRKRKADLGVIFDADGDRVFFIDDKARKVNADEAGYALAQMFKPPFVVGTNASDLLIKNNGKVFVSKVGHYFFKKVMRFNKTSFGAEHSGHFYFKDFFYCDCGILAALHMMNFVSGLKIKFSQYLDGLPKYFRSEEINFRVKNKIAVLKKLESFYAKKQVEQIVRLDGLTMRFGSPAGLSGQDAWWFNARPSNTENLLRLNMEATDKKIFEKELKNIKKIISS